MMVEEENWVCEEESSDEEDHLVKGHCLMADFGEPDYVENINDGPNTQYDNDNYEVSSIPDLSDTVAMLETKICDLERELLMEMLIQSS